jgi:tetratricopeptide (TPR) repeat protein
MALERFHHIRQKHSNTYYVMEEEYNSLGKHMHWEGKHTTAIAVYHQGLLEFPRSALLYDNLAGVFMQIDQDDSAVFYYQKSLEISPENRNALEILKVLEDQCEK